MEKICFVYSRKDPASYNLYKKLKELENFNFYETKEILFFDEFSNIKQEKIIFLSKHESKEKIKSICLHFSGNFGEAIYGGKEKELSIASPTLLKKIFIELAKNNIENFNLTLEATHHGPLCSKPHCFIEIGSSKKDWKNEKIAKVIAGSIFNSLREYNKNKYKIGIGFGGNHYCAKFNEIELKTDFALGHICPKYAIDGIDYNIFKQMIERNDNKIKFILIDKKGTKTHQRKKIENFTKKYNNEKNENIVIKLI